jgi:ribosomal protein L29
MKFKQIKAMKKEEAEAKLAELYKDMIKLRTQISSGSNIKNPASVRNTKKTIAKLIHNLSQKK